MAQWERQFAAPEKRTEEEMEAHALFGRAALEAGQGSMLHPDNPPRQSFSGHERNVLFQNRGDGTFDEVASVLGMDLIDDGRGFAVGDFDNDGDQDVVVQNNPNGRPLVLLRNDLEKGNALRVVPRRKKGNTRGIGTVVRARIGDRWLRRDVEAGSGFLSQSDGAAWFGLGSAETVDKLEIRWTGGETTTLENVRAGGSIVVRKGEGIVQRIPFREKDERLKVQPTEPPPWQPFVLDRVKLKTLDGEERPLTAYEGRPILIEAFSTDCPVCREERDHLRKLARIYQEKGLVVLGVAVGPGETPDKVRHYAETHEMNYPVFMKTDFLDMTLWQAGESVPSAFLISTDGRLLRSFRGRAEMADLEWALERELKR